MTKLLDKLGPVDTAFLYAERPETPMNIGALAIFEGKLAFGQLVDLVAARIHQVPQYHHKLSQSLLNLSQPAWVLDPDFHVERHLFRARLEAPGSDEQLRHVIGRIVSRTLDRNKPLWEIHLIDGLSNDRTAILFKLHHCMVDGLAAVELTALLLDFSPDAKPQVAPPPVVQEPPATPNGLAGLVESLKKEVPFKLSMIEKLGSDLAQVGSVLADKEKRRKTFVGVANLLNDNLRPIHKLPINGRNSGRITVAWMEFPLSEVRAIKEGHKASVNDVMLSVLGGGVGRYFRDLDLPIDQDFMRVLVPVNVRHDEEKGEFGNRISLLPIDIPLEARDPLARLDAVADYSLTMKQSSLSSGLDILLTLPALAPGPLQPLVWGLAPTAFSLLAHTWCTNVAGPQLPVYLAGHKLLHSYGFFPLNPSMGLASVILSYNGQISLMLIADAGIVPDITELKRHTELAYAELRKAANVPEMLPVPKPAAPAETKPDMLAAPSTTLDTAASNASPATPDAASSTPESASADSLSDSEQMAAEPQPVPVIVPIPQPEAMLAAAVRTSNGALAEDKPTLQEPSVNGHRNEPVVVAPPKLFSEEWAAAYQQAINNNDAYRNVSVNWDAGPLAFVMRPSPQDGYPIASAVLMDLYKGQCRSARSATPNEAVREAAFVIEADYATWVRLLAGKDNPLFMLIRGKLTLRKGSLPKLLPYTASAQELVRSAQMIS